MQPKPTEIIDISDSLNEFFRNNGLDRATLDLQKLHQNQKDLFFKIFHLGLTEKNDSLIAVCLACVDKSELATFLQQNGLCDIELRFGTDSIKTNKALLSAKSDYYAALFKPGMREAQTKTIDITEYSFPSFSQALDCLLFGTIKISRDTIEELLEIADFYGFETVMQKCEQWLQNHFHSLDRDQLYDLAMKYDFPALKNVLANQLLKICFKKPVDLQKLEPLFKEITELDLSGFRSLPDEIRKLLGQCQSLRTLNLAGCNWIKNNDEFQNLFGQCKNLKTLNLSDCTWVNVLTFPLLPQFTELEKLDLYNCNNSDLTPLASLTKLRSLNLGQYSPQSSLLDITPLTNLPLLEELNLRHCKIDPALLSLLTKLNSLELAGLYKADLSFTTHLSELTHLNLEMCGSYNADYLKYCKKLKSLTIEFRDLRDVTVLSTLNELETLNLRDDEQINLDIIRTIPKLKVLTISGMGAVFNNQDFSKICQITGLQYLELANYNEISDISTIKYLNELKTLKLRADNLKDLSPLCSLTKLTTLHLGYGQHINNIEPLTRQAQLQNLSITACPIYDLSPLSALVNLKHLTLDSLLVSDLSPFGHLTHLQSLNLAHCNNIQNIKPVATLTKLKKLDLANLHKITDLSSLTNSKSIKTLVLAYCSSLKDISFAKHLKNLKYLNIVGSDVKNYKDITDQNPFLELDNEYRKYFQFQGKHYTILE